jgi:hypothetical protein
VSQSVQRAGSSAISLGNNAYIIHEETKLVNKSNSELSLPSQARQNFWAELLKAPLCWFKTAVSSAVFSLLTLSDYYLSDPV